MSLIEKIMTPVVFIAVEAAAVSLFWL